MQLTHLWLRLTEALPRRAPQGHPPASTSRTDARDLLMRILDNAAPSPTRALPLSDGFPETMPAMHIAQRSAFGPL